MNWTKLALGPVQANAYIIENDNHDAVIIDPGGEAERLITFVQSKQIHPIAILLTHAHFDHIGAVDAVRKQWNIPVYVHENEQDWLQDTNKNGSAHFPLGKITAKPADHIIEGEGSLEIGPFSFDVFETPGHSPGSVTFYNQPDSVIFSGDVLFASGIGRTDLYGGNQAQLLKSIEEKLLVLPDETTVASGHGPETTIGREKGSNPFL